MKTFSTLLFFAFVAKVFAFPSYGSLAGLSERELAEILPTLEYQPPLPPPGPSNDTSTKLVNDEAHPWKPLEPGDIRGPCPGLNTLASHGYLPRNGIATPTQIINAVQEGFNMENDLAIFVTYAAFLVDGNVVTGELSIGEKSNLTGPDPPAPAIVGGLNTHAVFEGDSSMTRGDAFFGNNHDLNATLFQQFIDFSNKFGAGYYNLTVAAELRHQRIQESIATNPNFTFTSPRYFTAFGESVFPINFFVDGRKDDGQLDMDAATGFFRDNRMPDGFFRPNGTKGASGIDDVYNAYPIEPGANAGALNSYTFDPLSANLSSVCLLYENFVNKTVKSLYPNPQGVLRQALDANLDFFHTGLNGLEPGCEQVYPWGKA